MKKLCRIQIWDVFSACCGWRDGTMGWWFFWHMASEKDTHETSRKMYPWINGKGY